MHHADHWRGIRRIKRNKVGYTRKLLHLYPVPGAHGLAQFQLPVVKIKQASPLILIAPSRAIAATPPPACNFRPGNFRRAKHLPEKLPEFKTFAPLQLESRRPICAREA